MSWLPVTTMIQEDCSPYFTTIPGKWDSDRQAYLVDFYTK